MRVTRLQLNALWATSFLFIHAIGSLFASYHLMRLLMTAGLPAGVDLSAVLGFCTLLAGSGGASMGAMVWVAKHFAQARDNGNGNGGGHNDGQA